MPTRPLRSVLDPLRALALAAAVALGSALAAAQTPPAPAQPPRPRPAPAPPQKGKPGQKPPPEPMMKATVVTEGAYPPFNSVDAQGRPGGFEVELAAAICQRARIDCRIVTTKWDDVIPGLLDKRYDVAMSSIEITQERRKRLAFGRRYYTMPAAFVAAKGAFPADGAQAVLKGRTVGVAQASTHADYLEKSSRKLFRIKRFPTPEEALKELAAGKVDAVLGGKVALWQWVESRDGACCALFGPDVKDVRTLGEGVAAAFRKDDLKLREAFNKGLADLIADGGHKRIADKYFPFPVY
ncbi:MAG: transporter substrate-binding domain-containing protein [Rhodospirillales bacterium]|nr:MAG: transporter substrate-binding domain-containing protein [Rhodospirillales bacterium]